MVHAFIESGQEAPPAAQRYIESGGEVIQATQYDTNHPGRTVDSSTDRQIVSAGSYIASRSTLSSHLRYHLLFPPCRARQQGLNRCNTHMPTTNQTILAIKTSTRDKSINHLWGKQTLARSRLLLRYRSIQRTIDWICSWTWPRRHTTKRDLFSNRSAMLDPAWERQINRCAISRCDPNGRLMWQLVGRRDRQTKRFERDGMMTGDNPLQWQDHEFYAARFYEDLYLDERSRSLENLIL
jgi:hypothetical protein